MSLKAQGQEKGLCMVPRALEHCDRGEASGVGKEDHG